MKSAVCVLLLAVVINCASADCNVQPKYWCDSDAIAEKCGALQLCQDYFLTAQSNPQPVQVDLYYESLCPYCRQFITEQLYPTWNKLYNTRIFNVSIVPYGNAQEKQVSPDKYEYECQHGPDECTLNLVENCVMKHTGDAIEKYFPVINCIESSDQPIADSKKCVEKAGLKWKTIEKCVNGSEGNMLIHKAAMKTSALNPPHKYVPWIVVNGAHSDDMQQDAQSDLLKFVCDTYTGDKPSECGSFMMQQYSLKH